MIYASKNRGDQRPSGGIIDHSRYEYLRNHLTRLGYNAKLPHDAVDICESVFLDLVDLTRRFRDLKVKEKNNVNVIQQMEAKEKNLRQEHTLVVKKLNKMHQDKMKESKQSSVGLKESSELEGYKYQNSQLAGRLKASEKEIEQLKEQLNNVYKNKGVFVTHSQPMDKNKPVVRGQSIQQIGLTGPTVPLPSVSNDHLTLVDELKKQVESLSMSRSDLLAQEADREKEITSLRNDVKNRDSEIQRLNKMCASDESFEQLNRKLVNKSNQETNEFLNQKVNFLNSELTKAEKQLQKYKEKDVQIKQMEKEKRNVEEKWSNDLKEIDRLRDEVEELRLQAKHEKHTWLLTKEKQLKYVKKKARSPKDKDTNAKIKTLKRDLSALQEENDELSKVYHDYKKDKNKLNEVLQQRDNDILRYRTDIKKLKEDLEEVRMKLEQSENTKRSALSKAEACEEDVGFHQKNVSDLTVKWRDTTKTIQRLQRELEDSKTAAKSYLENNIALQSKLQTLEEDLKAAKDELAMIQKKEVDATRSYGILEKKKDALRNRVEDSETHLDTLRKALSKKCSEHESESKRADAMQAELSKMKEDFDSSQEKILKWEIEYSKLKCEEEMLKDELESKSRELKLEKNEREKLDQKFDNNSNNVSVMKELEQKVHVLSLKNRQTAEEVLSLQNLLVRKEEEAKAREAVTKKLSDDELNLSKAVKEKESEIQELVQKLHLLESQSTCSWKHTEELQTELLVKERKINECRTNLEEITQDVKKRDIDINDLTQKLNLVEKKFLDQKEIAVNCETSLKKSNDEVNRLRNENERAQGRIRNLEQEMERKQNSISRVKDEKHTIDMKMSELSRDLIDAENQLRKKTQLLENQNSMIAKIDSGLGISNEEIVRCRREITECRSRLAEQDEIIETMKSEYRELQQHFNSKISIIKDLTKKIAEKETNIKQADIRITELEEKTIEFANAKNDIDEELQLWKEGHRKEAEYNAIWEKTYEKLKLEFNKATADNVEKAEEIDKLRNRYNELDAQQQEFHNKLEKLQDVTSRETRQNSDLRQALEQIKNELVAAKETNRIACDKETALEDVVRQRNRELEILKSKSYAESDELVTLRSELERFHRLLGQKDTQILKLQEKLGCFVTDNQKLNRENAKENKYINDLKTMLNIEKENISRLNADVRALKLRNSEQIQSGKEKDRMLQTVRAQMEQLNDKLAHKETAYLNLTRKFEKEQRKREDYHDQFKKAMLDQSISQNQIELLNQDLNVQRIKYTDLENSHKLLNQQVEIIQRYRPIK